MEITVPVDDEVTTPSELLQAHFTPEQTALPRKLLDKHWNKHGASKAAAA